jgi:hypothetical protein
VQLLSLISSHVDQASSCDIVPLATFLNRSANRSSIGGFSLSIRFSVSFAHAIATSQKPLVGIEPTPPANPALHMLLARYLIHDTVCQTAQQSITPKGQITKCSRRVAVARFLKLKVTGRNPVMFVVTNLSTRYVHTLWM